MRSLITLGAACAATLIVVATAAAARAGRRVGPEPVQRVHGGQRGRAAAVQHALHERRAGDALGDQPDEREQHRRGVPAGPLEQRRRPRARRPAGRRTAAPTWHPVAIPGITKCSGGIYDRASDPWVSFAPNGDLYSLSLSFDVFDNHNAIIVNKSTNGGESWGPPLEVTADDTDGLDKQSITADPYNSNLRLRGLGPLPVAARDQRERPGQDQCALVRPAGVVLPHDERRRQLGAAARPLQPGHARVDDRKHRRRPAERDPRPPRRPDHHRRPQVAASRQHRSRSSARRITASRGRRNRRSSAQIDPTFQGAGRPGQRPRGSAAASCRTSPSTRTTATSTRPGTTTA